MDSARVSFLANAGWANATPSPVAGDLSTRQYTRLSQSNVTAILMTCDPATDTSLPAFLKMTRWLQDQSLSAPDILAVDTESGFALLEDFGTEKLTTLISKDPASQRRYYEVILDTLIAIRNAPAPKLPEPTVQDLCDATTLADEWYPNAKPAHLDAFRAGLEPVLAQLLQGPRTVSLRDFHADNIMWLADRHPLRQPGLLDYQDAFLISPAYDLMSLLTDARTDVAPQLQRDLISAYARRTGDDPADLGAAFAALGVQRNLRILGIFARAARREGKAHHVPALPRVYRYLNDCCRHATLAHLADDLAAGLPAPSPERLEGLTT